MQTAQPTLMIIEKVYRKKIHVPRRKYISVYRDRHSSPYKLIL
jgi:hypothetical protein